MDLKLFLVLPTILFVPTSLAYSSDGQTHPSDTSLHTEIQLLKRKFDHQEEELRQLRRDVDNCGCLKGSPNQNVESKRLLLPQHNSSSGNVAFFAHLTKNLAGLGNHQPIVFDAVRYNYGNGYKNTDGEFRAQIPGTYFFIWTISNGDRTYMQSEIVKDGISYGQIIADAAEHDDWAVATSFAIIPLLENDRVWIRSGTVHNGIVSGTGFGTSSFAGFRLW